MARVLLLNGSPHAQGCVATALEEMISVFKAEGVETELVHVGNKPVRGCVSCGRCSSLGRCVFGDDPVNELAPIFEAADGLVVGSPVYYGSPNGTLMALLDRLFYSTSFSKVMKVGAAVVSCRRGGNTASFDVLNKYFKNQRDAGGLEHLLEPDPRLYVRGRQEGSRGAADDAEPCAEHDLPDARDRGTAGEDRPAGDGTPVLYKLPGREMMWL